MDLLVHDDVVIIVILAALGVANDNILGPRLLDHLRSDLTGIGAVVLIVAGLRADGDVAVLEQAVTAVVILTAGTHRTTLHHLAGA